MGRVRWVPASALESPTSPRPSPPPRAEREIALAREHWWIICEGPLAAHRRGAVEAGGDRVERDVGPALRVHELLPAPIEEALVVLRDVPLGDDPWIIRMRPRVPQAHRHI